MLNRTISIAPMMDWTDRFDRYFLRLITRHALLYTEMVHANALIHGDAERFLQFDVSEHPVAIQLGGSDPQALATAAKLAADYGYDEVNLNVGCPSDRVQAGKFGACLMAEPELVADCVTAMREAVDVPVTVKSRIGIDKNDSYEYLHNFVVTVAKAGCKVFIIHARSAWLKGLSPKENRDVPPLNYEHVYRIKQDFPELNISVNGGIKTLSEVSEHLKFVDGVMIGRQAYNDPYSLATVDRDFYQDDHPIPTRIEIVQQFLPYIEHELKQGIKLSQITRHILGLFQGQPNARLWRRHLSENAPKMGAGIEVIEAALSRLASI
tara:strand:- start:42026 stop:42994 length:969 start_codon:yes stop_codon:yes gene_type:complete